METPDPDGRATPSPTPAGLLGGIRVVECSLLSPDAVGQHLVELGAEVIKVEVPGEGDYVRKISWPMIHGVSLEHLHWNRGKRSIALDLKATAGMAVFLDLVRSADAVVEGMRPGALDRLGLTAERMRAANPRLVICRVSGYGGTGPYRTVPSHGLAFDAMAGIAPPSTMPDGHVTIPSHTSIGMQAGPLYAALGVVSAIVRARTTGAGCTVEVAQADAAIGWNWLRVEGELAYEQPDDVVTGNAAGVAGARRAIGFDDFGDAVRYQYYRTSDGCILVMASERKFWRNLCVGIGRPDLFERYPGRAVADHAEGEVRLRDELAAVFRSRTTAEWMGLAVELDVPLAPVHDAVSLRADPQVAERIEWLPAATHGTGLMRTPIKVVGEALPEPRPAPTVGQDTDHVLRDVLGYSGERVTALRGDGVVA